ncbi:hypothetical protein MACH09_42110 [Vibrio sp. MACH09]|uniref:hypothetical protein n=1 Tax=Vibrio sp. MACH09 TaxID=3025122 RepID=UPI002793CDBA|nr:hypothetical protein [Vibrio sp. MACH09]GLO63703.1 hypothetical protein MACH09_42110 [Vibrio sp. MACH09]
MKPVSTTEISIAVFLSPINKYKFDVTNCKKTVDIELGELLKYREELLTLVDEVTNRNEFRHKK